MPHVAIPVYLVRTAQEHAVRPKRPLVLAISKSKPSPFDYIDLELLRGLFLGVGEHGPRRMIEPGQRHARCVLQPLNAKWRSVGGHIEERSNALCGCQRGILAITI